MKKVLANLILINILAILLLPSLVSSAVPPPGMAVSPPRSPQFAAAVGNDIVIEPPITVTNIPELIETITIWVFRLGLILAPLMILVGAFYFLTAGGSPEKIATGKKIILWTIIGLGIILFSRIIISIIEGILMGTP